jgi:hypothetical protein
MLHHQKRDSNALKMCEERSEVNSKKYHYPFQFILFASIVAMAAALPGYYSGQEYAGSEAAHEYGQISRGDHSHEHYDHHEEPVDYYVRIPI